MSIKIWNKCPKCFFKYATNLPLKLIILKEQLKYIVLRKIEFE